MASESGTLFFWLVLACLASITLELGILGWPTSGLSRRVRPALLLGWRPGRGCHGCAVAAAIYAEPMFCCESLGSLPYD